MGKQSARIYYQGKDHKDIYYDGHYHDAMYLGSQLLWKKIKQGWELAGYFEGTGFCQKVTYGNGMFLFWSCTKSQIQLIVTSDCGESFQIYSHSAGKYYFQPSYIKVYYASGHFIILNPEFICTTTDGSDFNIVYTRSYHAGPYSITYSFGSAPRNHEEFYVYGNVAYANFGGNIVKSAVVNSGIVSNRVEVLSDDMYFYSYDGVNWYMLNGSVKTTGTGLASYFVCHDYSIKFPVTYRDNCYKGIGIKFGYTITDTTCAENSRENIFFNLIGSALSVYKYTDTIFETSSGFWGNSKVDNNLFLVSTSTGMLTSLDLEEWHIGTAFLGLEYTLLGYEVTPEVFGVYNTSYSDEKVICIIGKYRSVYGGYAFVMNLFNKNGTLVSQEGFGELIGGSFPYNNITEAPINIAHGNGYYVTCSKKSASPLAGDYVFRMPDNI